MPHSPPSSPCQEFPSFPRPRLVIFDCDGVLVDSEGPSQELMVLFAGEHGVKLTLEEAEKLFLGQSQPQIIQKIGEMAHKEMPESALPELRQRLTDIMRKKARPMAGASECLADLRARGIPYRVGSNSSGQEMKAKFATSRLENLIEKNWIYSAADLGRPKPDPYAYLLAAREAGVLPEECIVVEDSDPGALAAREAGMRCILLRPENQKPAAFMPCRGFIQAPDMRAVKKLLLAAFAPERAALSGCPVHRSGSRDL